MKKKCDVILFNNNKLILENKNIPCIYNLNESVIFNDEYGTHNINFLKKVYTKTSKDNIMSIDFIKSVCSIDLLEHNNNISFDIDASFLIKEDVITLRYNFDLEEIKIIINLKV